MKTKEKILIFKRTIAFITLWIFCFSNVSFALRPQSAKDRLPNPSTPAAAETQSQLHDLFQEKLKGDPRNIWNYYAGDYNTARKEGLSLYQVYLVLLTINPAWQKGFTNGDIHRNEHLFPHGQIDSNLDTLKNKGLVVKTNRFKERSVICVVSENGLKTAKTLLEQLPDENKAAAAAAPQEYRTYEMPLSLAELRTEIRRQLREKGVTKPQEQFDIVLRALETNDPALATQLKALGHLARQQYASVIVSEIKGLSLTEEEKGLIRLAFLTGEGMGDDVRRQAAKGPQGQEDGVSSPEGFKDSYPPEHAMPGGTLLRFIRPNGEHIIVRTYAPGLFDYSRPDGTVSFRTGEEGSVHRIEMPPICLKVLELVNKATRERRAVRYTTIPESGHPLKMVYTEPTIFIDDIEQGKIIVDVGNIRHILIEKSDGNIDEIIEILPAHRAATPRAPTPAADISPTAAPQAEVRPIRPAAFLSAI